MPNNNFDDNEIAWAAELNALASADLGEAILSGADISKGTGDFETDVSNGTIIIDAEAESIFSTSVTHSDTSAMAASETRIDLVTADDTGTVSVTEGTAADNPVSPDIPADNVLLGFWQISGDDSQLNNPYDMPDLIDDITALYKEGGQFQIDAAELSAGQGTAGEVLQTDGTAASWVPHSPVQITMIEAAEATVPINSGSFSTVGTHDLDAQHYEQFTDGDGAFVVLVDPDGGITVRCQGTDGTTVAQVSSTATGQVELTDTNPTASGVASGSSLVAEAREDTAGSQAIDIVALTLQ